MMNNLQVKDAINTNRNSSNHDDKSHPTFAPPKDRPSSDSPHPYHSSEPIPSESADQASLPDGSSAQPAPSQFSPSAPQPSLPAMYPIQYYPIYPSNLLFPSNFQPAVPAVPAVPSVSPFLPCYLDGRLGSSLRFLLRFADRRAEHGRPRSRAVLHVLPAIPWTQHELYDPRRALRALRVARLRSSFFHTPNTSNRNHNNSRVSAGNDAVLSVRRGNRSRADDDDERRRAGAGDGTADRGRSGVRDDGVWERGRSAATRE